MSLASPSAAGVTRKSLFSSEGRLSEFVRGGASAALGIVAACYLAVGFVALAANVGFSTPVDLRLRWIEQQTVYRGVNPQETYYPEELLPPEIAGQRALKGSYPPWAYGTGLVLVPPVGWDAARWYFAALNLTAAAAALYGLYCYGEHVQRGWGMFAAAAGGAVFANCVAVSYGQYSLIVATLLGLSLRLLLQGRDVAAGLAWAVAAAKPQVAGLFFLVPLILPLAWPRKLRFYATACGYLAATSLAVGWYVSASPWEMLQAVSQESEKFVNLSGNRLVIWASRWLGFGTGSKALAIAVAVTCAGLLATVRKKSLLTAFSVCALLAPYWSYSRHYDAMLQVIPLMQLLGQWRRTGRAAAAATLLLLGIVLWAPVRIDASRSDWYQAAYAAAALSCLFVVLTAAEADQQSSHAARTALSQTGAA